jgi:hypothetical protein
VAANQFAEQEVAGGGIETPQTLHLLFRQEQTRYFLEFAADNLQPVCLGRFVERVHRLLPFAVAADWSRFAVISWTDAAIKATQHAYPARCYEKPRETADNKMEGVRIISSVRENLPRPPTKASHENVTFSAGA